MGNKDQLSKKEIEYIKQHFTKEDIKKIKRLKKSSAASEVAATIDVAQEQSFQVPKKIQVIRAFKVFALLLVIISALFVLWQFIFTKATQNEGWIIENVHELAVLATAEAHVKTVIEKEDNKLFGKEISFNLPGTHRKILLIVPATVVAGVDLQEVKENDISLNEETKELEITLPHAEILQEPSIKMDQVQTFSAEGFLRGEIHWDEGYDLAAEAKKLVRQEAHAMNVLETAETNAEKVLKEFFSNLGYHVTITFQ